MKKKCFAISKIFVAICIFTVCFVFVGCSKKTDIKDYMSDVRKCMYAADSQNYFVTAVSGQRENPYAYDGVKNACVDFCIVSLYPLCQTFDQSTFEVELVVGDVIHEITLEKSPYENAYMADIGSEISNNQNTSFKCDELGIDLDLVCVSQNWEIDYNAAIEIAKNELKDKFEQNTSSNTLKGECYLKILFDKSRDIKTYYWYFSFVDVNRKSFSCVIDPQTGTVLAKI